MRKVLSVARHVLTLLFRSGTGWGVLGLSVGLTGLMFGFARGDGTLLGELQIRTRYALYFLSGVLNLVLMYLACVSIRKDIEERQFHMVSAAPVHRGQIWLGKYLGLVVLAFIALVCGGGVIAACATGFIARWDDDVEKGRVKEQFLRAYYACKPLSTPLADQVEREFRQLQAEGRIPAGTPTWQVKEELRHAARRREQTLAPGAARSWKFRWRSGRARGDSLVLKAKFYAEQKHQQVSGVWTLNSPERAGGWSTGFSGYPYLVHRLEIPGSQVPEADVLQLTFKGRDAPHLIFPKSGGVVLLYDNGSMWHNAVVLLLVLLLHTAALVALALCVASLFSFSVAVFVNFVMYAVGMGSGFFVSVVRDLQYDRSGLLAQLSTHLLQLGLWLTEGTRAPAATDIFTEGISIPLTELLRSWGPGLALYTAAAIALGIWFLTIKELDKHLHS